MDSVGTTTTVQTEDLSPKITDDQSKPTTPKGISLIFKSSYRRLGIALFGMTVYLVIGAAVFSNIEKEREKKNKEELRDQLEKLSIDSVNQIMNTTLKKICREMANGNMTYCISTVNRTQVFSDMFSMVNQVLVLLDVNNFEMNSTDEEIIVNWDIAGAFYFCLTTVTTIGYGNFAPTTDGTRALTVVYAVLGIPGFLYLCAQVSSMFENLFGKLRTVCKAEKSPLRMRLYYIYCIIIVSTLLIWIPLPMAIKGQGLNFVTSVYFLVISLTTVGYGDIYPTDPASGNNDSVWFRILYCLGLWLYMIVGLSLFANLLSLIQTWIGRAAEVEQVVPEHFKTELAHLNQQTKHQLNGMAHTINTAYGGFKTEFSHAARPRLTNTNNIVNKT